MLTPQLPENQKALVVPPQPVRVVLAEDSSHTLAMVLPPIDDLVEMSEFRSQNFSIEEHSSNQAFEARRSYQAAYSRLLKKEAIYRESPVFLSKLASMAQMAGHGDEAGQFAERAFYLRKQGFYAHKWGDALLQAGRLDDAEQLFSSLDLGSDVGANLKLAALSVEQKDISSAKRFVEAASLIDPTSFSVRLFSGGIDLYYQEYESAARNFRAAINERPTSGSAYSNMAFAYLGLGKEEKALASVKRAVALDPLNSHSLMLLADLAFRLERDEDSLPALRYFVEYEQKNVAVWSRVARAAYRIGKFDEAVVALKREGSLKDSSSVWNNLGAAYVKQKNPSRAIEAFVHAMRIDAEWSRTYFLAARNVAHVLSARRRYSELRSFAAPILNSDHAARIISDDEVADLLVFYVHSLLIDGHVETARQVAREALSHKEISDPLAIWLVGALAAYQALRGGQDDVLELALNNDHRASQLSGVFSERRDRYYNNVAFALAELGRLADAEEHLSRIVHLIHKSPYPTATFGLIQFKKGRVERAQMLYEEAIRLATERSDRSRIRQKLNLELGKYWAERREYSKAARLLEKASREKSGEELIAKEARRRIREIRSGE